VALGEGVELKLSPGPDVARMIRLLEVLAGRLEYVERLSKQPLGDV
jgi:hypothetical protein